MTTSTVQPDSPTPAHWPVRLATTVILALAAGVFAWIAWHVRTFVVDDAFITFRYSRNLADGYGPTYNPGAPPIEGYTTFLWMLLMAIPHVMHVDALVFAKLLGLTSAALLLVVCYRWTVRLVPQTPDAPIWAAVAVLLVAILPGTGIHAISGMETMLFTLLLTGLFYCAWRWSSDATPRAAMRVAIVALLLGLTRPEGNLAALVALAVLLARSAPAQRGTLLRSTALFYLMPAAIYFAWRVHYYGHLFPLSFYLKVSNQHAFSGLPDVKEFLGYPIVRIIVPAAIGLIAAGGRIAAPLAAVIALVVFFLFPAHIMAFEYRYLYPLYPFVCMLAATGLASIAGWMRNDPRIGKRAAWIGAGLAVLVVGMSMVGDVPDSIAERLIYARGMHDAHIRLGRELARVPGGPNGPLVALVDAGAIPYYSKWRALDTYGLNNPTVALANKHSVSAILAQRPDVLVLVSNDKDNFSANDWNAWEPELYQACLARGMVRMREYTFTEGDYYLWVMANPNNRVCRQLGWIPPKP